jgi:glycosyltransferase involved in cell wall biosynthesis
MLERQVDNWNRIAGELRKNISVVLVDDCSSESAAPIFEKLGIKNKMLLRFTEPGLWTMHEARNLGAMQCGKEDAWLFMSDIDLIATPEMLWQLQEKRLNESNHYTFDRKMLPNLEPHRYHCNSYLLRRAHFMAINGYDIDFCGRYGGGYGGDGEFARQLSVIAPRKHLKGISLIGVPKEVVSDANTQEWDRAEWKLKYRAVFDAKRKKGDMRSRNPIRRPWERLI